MATPKHVSNPDTEFETEIVRIKVEIETRFRELIACLRERERELLQQLEEISTAHRKEREKQRQSILELEGWLKQTQENIQSENLKELQGSLVGKISEKREEFDSKTDSKHLILDLDADVLDSIRKLGTLNTTGVYGMCDTPVVDYTGKVRPVVNTGTRGTGEGQFKLPLGVSIDYKNGHIYVADQCNDRVQVFTSKGKYLYKFGDGAGAGKMQLPLYIAIANGRLFVSQYNAGYLLLYDLNGEFIRQIGSKGNGNLEFNRPFGIAVSQLNGNIYVCDRANNRVQILSKYLTYESQFAVSAPRDIKLTTQHIHVLTENTPFLFSFTYKYTQVLQNMSTAIGNHLNDPYGFCIDVAGKFFISDRYKNMILIFDREGNFLSQIEDTSIKSPMGFTIDKKGRIVLVCQKPSLLLF